MQLVYTTQPCGVNTSYQPKPSSGTQPHTLHEGLGEVWQACSIWVQSCVATRGQKVYQAQVKIT